MSPPASEMKYTASLWIRLLFSFGGDRCLIPYLYYGTTVYLQAMVNIFHAACKFTASTSLLNIYDKEHEKRKEKTNHNFKIKIKNLFLEEQAFTTKINGTKIGCRLLPTRSRFALII